MCVLTFCRVYYKYVFEEFVKLSTCVLKKTLDLDVCQIRVVTSPST